MGRRAPAGPRATGGSRYTPVVAPLEPGPSPLDGLLRHANPEGDIPAQQSLNKLQSALFGRSRRAIQLGRYVIEERVGAGGSGVVYRALDPKHDRKVALKLLHAGSGKGYEAARARLLREAQLLAKLSHPNVVRIYDVGSYDPEVFDPSPTARFGHRSDEPTSPARGVYLAMEFLDGSDLARWLAAEPRPWEAVRTVFLAAGRGLAAAHEVGLIHRDFKPANVSIDSKGQVRVLDFGLARPLAKHIPDPSMRMTKGAKQRLDALARPFDATLTAPGTLLGTPAYMAPEQHDLQRGSALSDQYSFCLALYEAWYGHRPFLADNEQEMRRVKAQGQVLVPPDRSKVPPHLFEAVRRGLSPRPSDRFPTMESLLGALVAPPAARTLPRWLPWAAGLGAVLGVAAVGWSMFGSGVCDAAQWQSTWTAADRNAMAEHAAARAEPYVAVAATRVTALLDARVQAGERFESSGCEDPSGWTPAIETCTRRGRERLAALVDTLRAADGPTLVHASEALSRWPEPDACARRSVDPPLAALAETLDDARLLEAQGALSAALSLARDAHASAQRHGDIGSLVEAAGLLGHLALRHGALEQAEPALAEALWSAKTAGRPLSAVRAALDLLTLARQATPRPVDTPLWIRLARERAAMPELPASLRRQLYLGLGQLALSDGDLARAHADLDQGLALPEEPGDAAWVWKSQAALAHTLEREGHRAEARALRTRARAHAIEALGAGHPALAIDEG